MVGKNEGQAPAESTMLELELELAYPAAERRINVRGDTGTYFARVVQAGPIVAILVPWQDAAAAAEYAAGILHGHRIQLLERAEQVA